MACGDGAQNEERLCGGSIGWEGGVVMGAPRPVEGGSRGYGAKDGKAVRWWLCVWGAVEGVMRRWCAA